MAPLNAKRLECGIPLHSAGPLQNVFFRFIVPMRARKRMEAAHDEPDGSGFRSAMRAKDFGELSFLRSAAVPSSTNELEKALADFPRHRASHLLRLRTGRAPG